MSIRGITETGFVGLVCNDLRAGSIATGLRKEIKVAGRRETRVENLTKQLD